MHLLRGLFVLEIGKDKYDDFREELEQRRSCLKHTYKKVMLNKNHYFLFIFE